MYQELADIITQQTPQQSMIMNVERAIFDLRAGLPVMIYSGQHAAWVANVETMPPEELRKWGENSNCYLVLTANRANRIKLTQHARAPVRAHCHQPVSAGQLLSYVNPLAGEVADVSWLAVHPSDMLDAAAITLAKFAYLLPGMLLFPLAHVPPDMQHYALEKRLLCVPEADIMGYADTITDSMQIVSKAHVPLKYAYDTWVIAFRPRVGNAEHLAVVIGDISGNPSPLVRVHSSCVTGDILGSLRCDCGEQLSASIEAMANAGGGVLLYLNQEGRGIGIASKLKAYALQDGGLDTVDANEEMGFDADERSYRIAANMLSLLGVKSLRLMTNNPDKMEDLSQYGLNITERVPLAIKSNAQNAEYLDTKAKRCGHFL